MASSQIILLLFIFLCSVACIADIAAENISRGAREAAKEEEEASSRNVAVSTRRAAWTQAVSSLLIITPPLLIATLVEASAMNSNMWGFSAVALIVGAGVGVGAVYVALGTEYDRYLREQADRECLPDPFMFWKSGWIVHLIFTVSLGLLLFSGYIMILNSIESKSVGIREQLVRVAIAEEIYFAKHGEYTADQGELKKIDNEIEWNPGGGNSKDENLFIGISSGKNQLYTAVKASNAVNMLGYSFGDVSALDSGFTIQGNSRGLIGTCKDIQGCSADNRWNVSGIAEGLDAPKNGSSNSFIPDLNGGTSGVIYPNPGNTDSACLLISDQSRPNVFVPSNPEAFDPVNCLARPE